MKTKRYAMPAFVLLPSVLTTCFAGRAIPRTHQLKKKDETEAPSQLPKWFRDMAQWLNSGNELSNDQVTDFLGLYSVYAVEERDDLKGLHLKGLPGVDVMIGPLQPKVEKYGLTEDAIKTTVELRLRRHGIRVNPSPLVLHIIVNVLVDEEFDCTAVNVLVELLRPAVLLFNPKTQTSAAIWSKSIINLAPLDEITGVMKGVQTLVDEFINDYLAANPKEQPVEEPKKPIDFRTAEENNNNPKDD